MPWQCTDIRAKINIRLLTWVLFTAYSAVMLWLLFGQRIGYSADGGYLSTLAANFNPIPLHTITEQTAIILHSSEDYLVRHAAINLSGNIVLFVPLGIFIPHLFPKLRAPGRFTLTVLALIAAVELIQLFTLLGTCDIDDLILNTVSALLGYLIFKASGRIMDRVKRQEKRR